MGRYDRFSLSWNHRRDCFVAPFRLFITTHGDGTLFFFREFQTREEAKAAAEQLIHDGDAFAGYVFEFDDACYPAYVSDAA